MTIEERVDAYKSTHNIKIAYQIHNILKDVPSKAHKWPTDWVEGESWESLLISLKNFDKAKSKKGFRSYYLQTLIYRCMRKWNDENVIKIPANLRCQIQHNYQVFDVNDKLQYEALEAVYADVECEE